MKIQVGAARMMGDGSGDASVSVTVDGGRKRQVRVVQGMDDNWLLFNAKAHGFSGDADVRLIHPAATKDLPPDFVIIPDVEAVRQILAAARSTTCRRRVANHSDRVKAAIANMFAAGATHDEVTICINEALVKTVQET